MMTPRRSELRSAAALAAGLALLLLAGIGVAHGADIKLPGVDITMQGGGARQEVASAIKIILGLTVISLAPALLIAVTSFTRIVIVLSMLRHAMGMQETPPNAVLITLALFHTLFTKLPV